MYNLIVIGTGPAGLTAAIYAARYTLNTLVIGSSPGGQVAESGRIENYPGFSHIDGVELTRRLVAQVESLGAEITRGKVASLEQRGKGFAVAVNGEVYEARSVILATGVEPRKLGVPGEEELIGKGVSYCALCDAPLYKGKTVAMIGGGDSALDGALELAEHAEKIYLVHRRDEFRAKPDFVVRARAHPKIEFVLSNSVTQIDGKGFVTGITLERPFRGESTLVVDGVFIEIGYIPDRSLAEGLGLELDDVGYVVISEDMSTSVAGIFAAGDITTGSNSMKQIVTACAEGAIAAQSVYRYLGSRAMDGPDGSGGGRRPVVNEDLCNGCGLCTTIAGGTFELGEDGKARVKDQNGDTEKTVQEAIDSCPVGALGWG